MCDLRHPLPVEAGRAGLSKGVDRSLLPRLDDLPVPAGVTAQPGWSPVLVELAEWIGPHDALQICASFGGEEVYIPHNSDLSPFRSLLPIAKVKLIASVYGGSRFTVPAASRELRAARRASIIASVRAGLVSGSLAARICGTSRTHMSYIVNQTSEGVGATAAPLPDPLGLATLKKAADAAVGQLGAAGVEPAIVANVWAAIMAVWGASAAASEAPSSTRRDPILASFIDTVVATDVA